MSQPAIGKAAIAWNPTAGRIVLRLDHDEYEIEQSLSLDEAETLGRALVKHVKKVRQQLKGLAAV